MERGGDTVRVPVRPPVPVRDSVDDTLVVAAAVAERVAPVRDGRCVPASE